MLLSKSKKFIFIHIYKNAGTSITCALMPFALSAWQLTLNRMVRKCNISLCPFDPQPFHPHIKAVEIKESLGAAKYSQYFSFAIVRNPWDWQVSLYKFMMKSTVHPQHTLMKALGDFDGYIKWRCESEVRLQKDFIYDHDRQIVDFVGRYETLNSDFNTICSKIGVSASLPKLNVSNEKPYRSYYSEVSKERVRKAFESDIRLFDYEF